MNYINCNSLQKQNGRDLLIPLLLWLKCCLLTQEGFFSKVETSKKLFRLKTTTGAKKIDLSKSTNINIRCAQFCYLFEIPFSDFGTWRKFLNNNWYYFHYRLIDNLAKWVETTPKHTKSPSLTYMYKQVDDHFTFKAKKIWKL